MQEKLLGLKVIIEKKSKGVGRELALHTVDSGSIPIIPYGSLSSAV